MNATIKTISIETLAEKINGKLWVKGDLKRIYLDCGYNTKKMSTKAFIFEKDGEFIVSCRIECPSQPYQWIRSQEEEVKEGVYSRIESIINILNLELVDFKVLEEGKSLGEIMVYVKFDGQQPSWFTEESFYNKFGEYPQSVWEEVEKATLKKV